MLNREVTARGGPPKDEGGNERDKKKKQIMAKGISELSCDFFSINPRKPTCISMEYYQGKLILVYVLVVLGSFWVPSQIGEKPCGFMDFLDCVSLPIILLFM